MEITSPPPEPVKVEVIDIDIQFESQVLGVRLWPGDHLHESEDHIVISYVANPTIGRSDETVTVNRAHVLWISRRVRQVEILPPEEAKP
jgi:hypothetical protein